MKSNISSHYLVDRPSQSREKQHGYLVRHKYFLDVDHRGKIPHLIFDATWRPQFVRQLAFCRNSALLTLRTYSLLSRGSFPLLKLYQSYNPKIFSVHERSEERRVGKKCRF